jgi:aminopeptidase-like protein
MDDMEEPFISFINSIWSHCRSITGDGLRATLKAIQQIHPEMRIIEVPSGTQVLDWTVPLEWNIKEAWVKDETGKKIIDFELNNLHILNYSEPFRGKITKSELLEHLYVLEEQPDLIPYVTSYYKRRWGFCVSKNYRENINGETFEVHIDASLKEGSLSMGELYISGASEEELLFSTYCCHPSMANDQLSGVALNVFTADWIKQLPHRKYSYRFIFIPEIIGSAAYIHHHKAILKNNVKAAFNLTCVGDERTWSYIPSRNGQTLADKAVLNLLHHYVGDFNSYTWNDRASDESMFCAPGVDIPMVSMIRSKYGTFPEYHTSADVVGATVTEKGMQTSFALYQKLITCLENNAYPITQVLGEPQLGKRGLYPDLSMKGSTNHVKDMLNVLSYCDGAHDVFDISAKAHVAPLEVIRYLRVFKEHKLVN